MATATTHVTPEELLVLPDGKMFELVDGELRERHVSNLTSIIAMRLGHRLTGFTENGLGYVFGSDCGYQCFPHDPGRVRKPDVSFVSAQRMDPDEFDHGWMQIAPDLAVEVVSPNDIAAELQEKLDDYAAAGIPVVWVVYPQSESVVVHRPDGTSLALPKPVELVGEGPLEGFRCPYAELLPPTPKTD